MRVFGLLLILVVVSFVLGCLVGYKLKDYKLEEDLWEQDVG